LPPAGRSEAESSSPLAMATHGPSHVACGADVMGDNVMGDGAGSSSSSSSCGGGSSSNSGGGGKACEPFVHGGGGYGGSYGDDGNSGDFDNDGCGGMGDYGGSNAFRTADADAVGGSCCGGENEEEEIHGPVPDDGAACMGPDGTFSFDPYGNGDGGERLMVEARAERDCFCLFTVTFAVI